MPLLPEYAQDQGRALASKCSWNGDDILKICQAALTDANFHHEAEIIGQMLEAFDRMDQPTFVLTIIE
jgi:hypothetical protein